MSSVTVRFTMLEKSGTLLKFKVWVLAKPLGSPCGMFWLTVKERFVVVCPGARPAEDNSTAATTAAFINWLCGAALIESTIIQISQSFAIMFYAKFPLRRCRLLLFSTGETLRKVK